MDERCGFGRRGPSTPVSVTQALATAQSANGSASGSWSVAALVSCWSRTMVPPAKPKTTAVPRMIQIALPATGEDEWLAVREPLTSGWLTQGPKVAAFEKAFAE